MYNIDGFKSAKYIELENKVKKFIDGNKLINSGDTVVVATSGGADSMALLSMMYNMMNNSEINKGFSLAAVTVNHGIRGETADRDMIHVENFCKSIGIPCITFNAKKDGTIVPSDASEEWARQLRYKYFSSLPERLNTSAERLKIATAHTKSDQAETMLFRLSRNSSYKSLMGIPIKRDNFIRPFLSLTRKEVETICSEVNIEYMTDETNLGDDYARNKIRHSVLPVMLQINSSAIDHLADLANFNIKLNDYFVQKAKNIDNKAKAGKNKWDINKILEHPELEIDAFLNYIVEKSGAQPSKVNIEILKKTLISGGSVELNKNVTVRVETGTYENPKGTLIMVTKEPKVDILGFNRYIAEFLDKHEVIYLNHKNRKYGVMIVKVDLESAKNYVKEYGIRSLGNLTTYESLFGLGLKLCPTDSNDEFKPACRSNRKIKKMYKEMNIIPENISSVPCIKGINNRVVWLYNMGFTDGFGPLDKELNKTDTIIKSKRPDDIYIVQSI